MLEKYSKWIDTEILINIFQTWKFFRKRDSVAPTGGNTNIPETMKIVVAK